MYRVLPDGGHGEWPAEEDCCESYKSNDCV